VEVVERGRAWKFVTELVYELDSKFWSGDEQITVMVSSDRVR
jgi:hypothetical protein